MSVWSIEHDGRARVSKSARGREKPVAMRRYGDVFIINLNRGGQFDLASMTSAVRLRATANAREGNGALRGGFLSGAGKVRRFDRLLSKMAGSEISKSLNAHAHRRRARGLTWAALDQVAENLVFGKPERMFYAVSASTESSCSSLMGPWSSPRGEVGGMYGRR